MEHKPYAELTRIADVQASPSKPTMTRQQRLERWAEVLEREPGRELRSLEEIEWKTKAERRDLRADGSPLTVAFEDPVLRAEGLASDRLGDAMAFFGLSLHDAHVALCSCVHGRSMQANVAANRVRHLPTQWHAAITNLSVIGGGIIGLLLISGLSGLIH
jgi:hypothetical protein